ncbi:hypothetical protein ERD95_07225 [Enterobacteriaceae bacterium ML5]|nr:hypothetical protein ERD95_07225 [Enterobacteriaceae bacterium ML5]
MPKPFVRVSVDRERQLPILQIFSLARTMNERLRAAIPDVETVISITGRDDISIQDRTPYEVTVIEAICREIWQWPER